MIYVYSFLVCGLLCLLGQIIIEETKLNYGEVNTLFVLFGSFLSFLGVYDKLISLSGAGASIPITNFGHLMFKGAYQGYVDGGITGLFKGLFSLSGAGIAFAVICAFVFALIFRPRD